MPSSCSAQSNSSSSRSTRGGHLTKGRYACCAITRCGVTHGIMAAYRDDARTALGHGFCAACVAARSEAELGQDVVAKLRAEVMPDLRILPTPSRPGHA
jgi:hypothetical protein